MLIIDDFLATGATILGLVRLAEAAGAKIVGIGALIEKTFEGGRAALKPLGIPVESLAAIASMDDGKICSSDATLSSHRRLRTMRRQVVEAYDLHRRSRLSSSQLNHLPINL